MLIFELKVGVYIILAQTVKKHQHLASGDASRRELSTAMFFTEWERVCKE